jgi:DtxR family Mn-dependent transcriptional regulator
LAKEVLRRHYLLEHLLVRLLGYPWDKADEEAKRLQTEISKDLAEHLYSKLGAPQTCPHGNPMPGSELEKSLLNAPKLHEAPREANVMILRITEEGEQIPSMLAICFNHRLQPGGRFLILGKDENMIILQRSGVPPDAAEDEASFSLPVKLAEHIRYENVADQTT